MWQWEVVARNDQQVSHYENLFINRFFTVADKGKRTATSKRRKYINDAEPNTCNYKMLQQQNAANKEMVQNQNDTNPKTHAIEKCSILGQYNGSINLFELLLLYCWKRL